MEITLDISMYPLREDYENQILDFISKLENNSNFTLIVNALSTQIQGDHKVIMDAVNKAIAEVYENGIKASFVLKILPGGIDLAYNHNA